MNAPRRRIWAYIVSSRSRRHESTDRTANPTGRERARRRALARRRGQAAPSETDSFALTSTCAFETKQLEARITCRFVLRGSYSRAIVRHVSNGNHSVTRQTSAPSTHARRRIERLAPFSSVLIGKSALVVCCAHMPAGVPHVTRVKRRSASMRLLR